MIADCETCDRKQVPCKSCQESQRAICYRCDGDVDDPYCEMDDVNVFGGGDSRERAKVAYNAFRNGFPAETWPMPEWDKAPIWVRDVVLVAYLQGTLDAPPRKDSQS